MIFITIIFVKSTKNPLKYDFRIISYVGRAHWSMDNWSLAQNIRLREVFYTAQIMTTLILRPHTISDLTLTSVRRNNVLKWVQSFPRTKNSINLKQQNTTTTTTTTTIIHHRISKDKGNTMIWKNMPNLKKPKKSGEGALNL